MSGLPVVLALYSLFIPALLLVWRDRGWPYLKDQR